jgi:hypothetical protein
VKRTILIIWLSATACLAAIPAVNAQDVTCENANFSEAVLESFGSVRYSCREIVQRDGSPHALLRAKVVRAKPPNLTVRFHRTDDGKLTNPYTFNPEDNYIFTMDGEKKLSLRELSAGNELRVYVPVTGPAG